VGSAGLHLVLSQAFYFRHAMEARVIDGGPLGFLSWTIPTLAGTLAYDLWRAVGPRRAWGWLIIAGAAVMGVGYAMTGLGPEGLSPPPFVPLPESRAVDLWTMSQRTGSVSYQAFAAGLSLAVYGLFVLACDVGRLGLPLFRTFGTNALAAYVIHMMVADAVAHLAPGDAPAWYVLASLLLYLGITWLFVRTLERQGIFLKL
jgi:hypothetical protein